MKDPYRFYVYQWRNLTNGMLYIGKGTGQRARSHLRFNKLHAGSFIHRALVKHGEESFELICLEDGLTDAEAREREIYYIASRNCMAPHGYNLTEGGDGLAGYVMPDETKAKLSALKSGIPKSAETRAAMSAATTGRKKSAAHCEAIRAGKTGRKHSAEQSDAISKALMGHIHSDDTRAKIGAANKGKTLGRPKSPEHRAKLAAHLRAMHAKRKLLATVPLGQLPLL